MNELIIREDKAGVAYLTLNRADAYNSLSMDMMNALHEALETVDRDMDTRVIVIRGSGRGFCAGHDLKEMLSNDTPAFHQQVFETCSTLMQKITNLTIPVIAQIHGVATAAGCQLVATCDLAISSDQSRFGTPGVNIGLFCSTPMVALTRSVSSKHAMELLLTGDLIHADRAEQMGLINHAVEESQLESTVESLAEKIASKSRKTLSIGKQAYKDQQSLGLGEAYQHCSKVMADNLQTQDAREGIDAFISKRKPVWSHR